MTPPLNKSADDQALCEEVKMRSNSNSKLSGKRYLLTGASRGLGSLALEEMIKSGATVICVARNLKRLGTLQEQLGSRMICASRDLSDLDGLCEWAGEINHQYGPFDGVIHNAGIDDFQSMTLMKPDAIQHQINLNLTAPILINRALLPSLLERNQEAVIIHMSSVAGLIPTPFGSVYSATKSGLTYYNEALAIELGNSPIRLVTLHPGFVHGVGMHEAHKAKVGRAPLLMGGTTDQAVVKALMKALTRGAGRKIINRFAVRPLAGLATIAPLLTRWLSRWITYPYLSRVAASHSESTHLDE